RQFLSLIFFASIVGLAALGQHLVVVVGGLDLSVAPVISLCALVFANVARDSAYSMVFAGVVTILVSMGAGLLNGLAVTMLRITPLIATLGVAALATGAAYAYTGGVPARVPDVWNNLAVARPVAGLFSISTVIWIISCVLVSAGLRWTVL